MGNLGVQEPEVGENQPSVLHALRLVMVNRVLWVIVILAAPALVELTIEEVPSGRYGVVAIYFGLYGFITFVAAFKSLPPMVRALTAPTLLYLVAVVELWLFTVVSNASLYLFSFVILTGIFVGFRAGLAALAIAIATLIIAGWAYLSGHLPVGPQPPHLLLTRHEMARDVVNWLSMGIPFVFVSVTILVCLMAMLRALTVKTEEAEGLVRDLSAENEERRVTAQEREKAIEALLESEERYRQLAENVHDIIWTMDLNGNYTYVSPSVERVRGFTPEEVMAGGLAMSGPPENTQLFLEGIHEQLALEESGTADPNGSRAFEVKVLHKNGSLIDAEILISFLRDPAGKPYGVLGVTRDVTERKRAEREKMEISEQLRQVQKVESIGQLAGESPTISTICCKELSRTPISQRMKRPVMRTGRRTSVKLSKFPIAPHN